ncbi:D-alanyl-D-alanine carboxypeptidase [Brevibacterium sp. 5221]|uniref:D-alanyl-D-alanine carboxypeptidase n=1 Tax=Brevibacterium rongguiense TaxID=2695267 RepID=A0A6N9H5R5_9MICO|nr:M15 family metallopeptidase [Brevibacterium rongguiense]MYM19420.1 D-alanyl-D-alanine carboxypeptidase [Brevibacterium rongguiense]
MDQSGLEPVVRRRDLRKQEEAARRADRHAVSPLHRRTFSSAADAEPAPTAERPGRSAATAAARAVRGSDGSALRRHRRRRTATISALTTVSAAGIAIAAVLVGGNMGGGDQVQAAEGHVAQQTELDRAELAPEAVDGSAASADKDAKSSGAHNFAGGAPTANNKKAAAAASSVQRTALPGCSGKPPKGEFSNGQVPADSLCKIGVGDHKLRADAAVAFAKMNAAFKADTGSSMAVTDSYRSLDGQISVAGRKPGLAAKPGTSMHGWGIALDMAGGSAEASGTQYDWLVKNAAKYGWENPDWAKGGQYEPWHWEYVPARKTIKGH